MNFNIFQWRSLKTKITLFTLAIFLIGFWSLSFFTSRVLREDMQRLLGEQQFSTVSFMAAGFNEELDIRLRSLENIAKQVSQPMQENPAALQEILEQRPILQILFNGGIFLTGMDGTAIAAVPLSVGRVGVNYLERDSVAAALKEGKVSIGRPVMGKILRTPIFVMAAPIRDTPGNVIGALTGVIDLSKPNFLDKVTEGRYGKSGDYFITARNFRQIVTTSDKHRIMEVLPAPGINPMIDRYFQGYEGSIVGINPVGVEVLSSAKGIPVADWYVTAALPTEEAFGPIRRMQQHILLITFFMTLLVAGLTWWILRRLLSPMVSAAQTLATLSDANHSPHPLPITSQDEIGQLIGGFNRLLITLAQREEVIRESEKLLNTTQFLSKIGGWEWGVENRSMKWTDETYRIHDMTPGYPAPGSPEHIDISGACYAPDVRTTVLEAFRRCAEQGEPYDMEVPFTSTQGRAMWVRTMAEAVRDGNRIMKVVGYIMDITDRKQAEVELRLHGEILKNMAEGVYLIRAEDGVIVYVNPKLERMLGYDSAELIGKHVSFVNAPTEKSPEEKAEKIIQSLHADGIWQGEVSNIRKDGTKLWCHANVTTFEHPQYGNVWISIHQDITARKQAEQIKAELEAQNWQLQKAESLSRMAGAIAHHFNNQLAVVMGNLELTLEEIPRGGREFERLANAMAATRRAAEVSGLMLTYLGQTTAKKEPMDIGEVCRRSLPLLRATLPGIVRLETDLPSPGPAITGNGDQIQQVIANLITNAAESYDGRGSIHLSIKTVSSEIIPRTHLRPIDWHPRNADYVCLEVKDSGCGISEEDMKKIFDPFFTSKFPGRGLGLPVALGILKAHNGAIAVESELGVGSIFRVFLPVSAEEIALPPEKAAKTIEMEGGGTVLLIEDEEMVRSMAATMLTHLGFTVLEASDGVDAVAVFRKHTDEIRWALCDLTMPRMDGWETLAALRKLAPDLPVILYSGHDEGQVMAGNHPERPDVFLHKPFSMKALADAIRQIVVEK